MTVKSSISLTDEQHSFAKELVEAGRYSSLSAVLQQGIDLLRQRIQNDFSPDGAESAAGSAQRRVNICPFASHCRRSWACSTSRPLPRLGSTPTEESSP